MTNTIPPEDFHTVMDMAHRTKKYEATIEERGCKGKAPAYSRSQDYRFFASMSPLT